MSRYIDADNYKKDLIQLGFLPALVVSVLDKQPTADVVEVVRCKDCRFWDEECLEKIDANLYIPLEELWGIPLPIKSVGIGKCLCDKFYGDSEHSQFKVYRALNPLETTKDDYCSYGERREK